MHTATTYSGIGLMSGTSHDGVDIAACTFAETQSGWQWQIAAAETYPYDDSWRGRLLALVNGTAADLAKADADYGHYLGMLLRRFTLEHDVHPQYIASHGHTVLHAPHQHYTYQLGSGEVMVTHLNAPLVTNFRVRDVALGGQGAPLVPFAEWHLFTESSLFLNLGGIANLSVFNRSGRRDLFAEKTWLRPGWQHLGYDVCAAAQVLDALAQQHDPSMQYDANGAVARGGHLVPGLLAELAALDFYALTPPRSLGREWVLSTLLPLLHAYPASAADKLHTYTVHIAQQVAAELMRLGVSGGMMRVTGGGAHNAFLMQQLTEALDQVDVTLAATDELLINYKEALAFAFLGLHALLGRPNVLHAATGARTAAVAGSVHLPTEFGKALL